MSNDEIFRDYGVVVNRSSITIGGSTHQIRTINSVFIEEIHRNWGCLSIIPFFILIPIIATWFNGTGAFVGLGLAILTFFFANHKEEENMMYALTFSMNNKNYRSLRSTDLNRLNRIKDAIQEAMASL